MGKKNEYRMNYIAWYSAAFLLLYGMLYIIFRHYGKSFLWDPDGVRQHYTTLYYIGQCLKKGFGGGGFSMVDLKLGQGLDVLTTLNYYGFGDPLNLLSLFVRQKDISMLYTFLVFLRLYLAGLAFSYFCFAIHRKEKEAVLIGAIAYVFSGIALYTSVRHPIFINGMIYLPLLLVGAEKVLQKKRYRLFIGMVGLSLISNFYFAYMNTIMVGIYLLFRIFGMQEGTLADKLKQILKLCGAYILGVMLSAIVFLPVVYAFLQNARGSDNGGYSASMLMYDVDYYKTYITSYAAPNLWIGSWMIGGLSPLCLVSVLYFFFVWRKERNHTEERRPILLAKGIYITLFIFTLIPIFGKVLNGFGYVCNRWTYAFALSNAMLVVMGLPKMLRMHKRERYKLTGIVAGMILLIVFLCGQNRLASNVAVVSLAIITIILNVACVHKEDTNKEYAYRWVGGVTIISVIAFMLVIYLPGCSNYVKSFCKINKEYAFSGRSAIWAMSDIKDKSFYRVEQPWINKSNQGLVRGYHGNTFYWSLIPKNVTGYLDGLGLATLDRTYACLGLDSRAILNEISSTKYYVSRDENSGLVPYGYKFVKSVRKTNKKNYNIYKNRYALSIGYGLQAYMRQSEYDKLPVLQKQEALLSCVIIKDKDITEQIIQKMKEIKADNINVHIKKIPYKIKPSKGVYFEDGKITVTKKNATLEFQYDGKENCENYFLFHNLKVMTGINHDLIKVGEKGSYSSKISLFPRENSVYYKKEYCGIKVGNKKGKNTVVFTFPKKNSYEYDSFGVYQYDLKDYEKQVHRLMEHQLKDTAISNNRVSGQIDLQESQWVQISVPYSIGWRAYIDGKETKISTSDTAYMGLLVPGGRHKIVLEYETPYIKIGAVITFATVLILVVSGFVVRRKKEN